MLFSPKVRILRRTYPRPIHYNKSIHKLTLIGSSTKYIMLALFYCHIIKYRLHYVAFIVRSGRSAYLTIQVLIYYVMDSIGMADKALIFANMGFLINTIQLCSAVVAMSIAIVLKITGRGFSFIITPAHDTYKIKYTEYSNLIVLVSGLISTVIISLVPIIFWSSELHVGYVLIDR